MTELKKCNCENKYQDQKYGGKRVCNKCNSGWRCTACGNTVKEIQDKKK